MKLEVATRAVVAHWVATGAQALSIRVRLLERLGVDCPRDVVVAYVSEIREELAGGGLQDFHRLLGIRTPRPLTPKETLDLAHEAHVRARILKAWLSRADWEEIKDLAKNCGRDGRFAHTVVETYKKTRNLRGIRRRTSVLEEE